MVEKMPLLPLILFFCFFFLHVHVSSYFFFFPLVRNILFAYYLSLPALLYFLSMILKAKGIYYLEKLAFRN